MKPMQLMYLANSTTPRPPTNSFYHSIEQQNSLPSPRQVYWHFPSLFCCCLILAGPRRLLFSPPSGRIQSEHIVMSLLFLTRHVFVSAEKKHTIPFSSLAVWDCSFSTAESIDLLQSLTKAQGESFGWLFFPLPRGGMRDAADSNTHALRNLGSLLAPIIAKKLEVPHSIVRVCLPTRRRSRTR